MIDRKYALKEMTFVEFRERLTEQPVILLPFASQEEQGPHAPMGDFMLTERMSVLTAERADAIAAPTIPFGFADYFRAMPGGIQFRASTFSAVLEDVATSFLDHGIERLVVFNGHTGNSALIDQTVRKVRAERGIAIASINIWQILPQETWTKLFGADAAKVRGHGGEPVSSAYRHFFPELLRPDLVRPSVKKTALGMPISGPAGITFEGTPIQFPLNVTDINADGMLGGDATRGSAEIGAVIAETIIDIVARFVMHFRRCDPSDVAAGPQA